MNLERYRRVKELLAQALELEAPARGPFLEEACGGDTELRAEVEDLLGWGERAADDALGRVLESRGEAGVPDGSGKSAPGPEEPEQIGPYDVLEVLGEGGFGTVYRAQQFDPVRREVAVKVIKLGMDTRQVVARFEAERQALALMDHPSIARVFDAGATPEGRPYFVMELVAGEPITEFCDRESLTTRERLALFRQVCLAVQHAHQKGVLHRDLKPSNILVTRVDGEPQPKVIDFGIAKATEKPLTDSSLATEAFQIMGTPEYMPPEQASGIDVDTRADVYALGAVLYELLAGSSPFVRTSAGLDELNALLRQIHDVTPPKPSTRAGSSGESIEVLALRRGTPPSSFMRSLRGDLDWIVMKALEKDRERRYATASEFAEDIDNHLAHRPVAAARPSAIYRLRKLARRNRSWFAAGALVVLTMIGSVTALAFGYLVVREERDAAALAREQEADAREEAVRSQLEEATARARADRERGAAVLARTQEERQRKRAETALLEAREVLNFLTNALAAVRPGAMGREVTMRAVLDEATSHFDGRFVNQPRVEGRLRSVIGKSYLQLGELSKAEEHLERASALFDPSTASVVDMSYDPRRELAILYTQQERFDDAHPVLLALMDEAERLGSAGLPDLFDLANVAAVGHMERWENQAAVDIWEQQIRMSEGRPELESDRIIALGNLGIVYEQMDRQEEALELYEEALTYDLEHFGPEAPATLRVLNNMGSALTALARYDEAEERFIELIETRVRVLGEDHPETASSIFNLALVYLRTGRLEEAAELTSTVLEIETRVLGELHPTTVASMNQLAIIRTQQGRLEEATELLREAVRRAQSVLGELDSDRLNPMQSLADLLADRGLHQEALELYEEVLPQRIRIDGEGSYNTLALYTGLASSLAAVGRGEEGARRLLQGLEARLALTGPEFPDIADGRNALGGVLFDLGRFAEAAESFELALAAGRASLGESHPKSLIARMGLARARARLGLAAENRDFTAATVDLLVSASEGSMATPSHQAQVAEFLLKCEPEDLRDPDRALGLAARAAQGTEGRDPYVLTVLADAQEATGDPDSAAATRARLGELAGEH